MKFISTVRFALLSLIKYKDEYKDHPERYEEKKEVYLAAAKRSEKDTYDEFKDKV